MEVDGEQEQDRGNKMDVGGGGDKKKAGTTCGR